MVPELVAERITCKNRSLYDRTDTHDSLAEARQTNDNPAAKDNEETPLPQQSKRTLPHQLRGRTDANAREMNQSCYRGTTNTPYLFYPENGLLS